MSLQTVIKLSDVDLAVPSVIWDPTDRWPNVHWLHHMKACGFIPEWVDAIFGLGKEEDVEERVMNIYKMGGSPFGGFKNIDEDGILESNHEDDMTPQDPDLHPIALMCFRSAKVFQYPSAWVLFRVKGKPDHVYRMD